MQISNQMLVMLMVAVVVAFMAMKKMHSQQSMMDYSSYNMEDPQQRNEYFREQLRLLNERNTPRFGYRPGGCSRSNPEACYDSEGNRIDGYKPKKRPRSWFDVFNL